MQRGSAAWAGPLVGTSARSARCPVVGRPLRFRMRNLPLARGQMWNRTVLAAERWFVVLDTGNRGMPGIRARRG